MASEAKKGLLRVASNYARLMATVLLGIMLVPILIDGFGEEAYGVYGLLGASAGFAAFFKDIMRFAMNRELGHAWNDPDPRTFPAVYNSAILMALGMAGLSLLVFAALYVLVPRFTMPDELRQAARWVVVSAGANTFVTIVMAPQFRMYMAMERMVWYNFFITAERAAYVVTAATLFYVIGIRDPARGLTLYTIFSNLLSVTVFLVSVGAIVIADRRLIPNPRLVTRRSLRSVSHTGGWNVVTVLAMNLHIRLDHVIVNIFVTPIIPLANSAWAVAATLTSYVRMLTVGVTEGLDAVAARLSATGREDAIRQLMRQSTRVNAWVAAPAGVLLIGMTEPLLTAWLPEKARGVIPHAVPVIQVLTVGMVVRAVTDNWTRILYGAGHVRRYARQVFVGGLLNPAISIPLIFLLPDAYKAVAPAIVYSGIFIAVHFVLLPRVGARWLGVRPRDMILPALPPGALAVGLAPIPLTAGWAIGVLQPGRLGLLALLAGAAALYSVLYLAVSWRVVLTAQERKRLRGLLRRRGFGPGQCRGCGADLTGIADGEPCPGCGWKPRRSHQRGEADAEKEARAIANSTSTAL